MKKVQYVQIAALCLIVLGSLSFSSKAFLNSSSQLAQVISSGAVSYYTFNEGSGTTAGDSVGGNNGTISGGPAWVTGKIGSGALQFDGVDDTITLSGISIGTTHTVSFWINPGADSAYYNTILAQNTATGIYYNGTTGKINYYFNGDHNSVGTIPTGSWSHVAISVNNGTASVYINGNLDSTIP